VRQIAHRIAVMYLGQIVETGEAEAVLAHPRHPYTTALLSAVPQPDPTSRALRIILPGEPPSPTNPPSGCRFHPRCFHPLKDARCAADVPQLRPVGSSIVACHFAEVPAT
jgi:oligopeptide/dipeptide ABC transporter ATP-binding protein